MNERLIEIFLPAKLRKQAQDLLETYTVRHWWTDQISDRMVIFRVLTTADKIEALLDLFQKRFYKVEGFKLIVLPVEARVPREDAEAEADIKQAGAKAKQLNATGRISREELRAKIKQGARLSGIYLLLTGISALVASIGLMRDNVTIVIGAMVIAPLLGPNVALSLATTLADYEMVKHSLKTLACGVGLVLAAAVVWGLIFEIDVTAREVITRTEVGFGDIILALAAGIAGVLAYTSGLSASLVGVMVAVALLPPLAVCGLLLGSGELDLALNSGLLFFINLICINLAGVVVFTLQGIRPRTWWEAKKARRSTRISILIWAVLFIILVLVLFLMRIR